MPSPRRLAVFAFASLPLAYLLLAGLLFVVQRKLLFPAPPPRPVVVPDGARLLEIPGTAPVYALWSPPRADAPVLVAFHGNGEQLADESYELLAYRPFGLGFLAVELPGYGPAHAQKPSETACDAAAQTALEYLVGELGVRRDRIVLLGRSLGTGIAVEMASRGWGRRLVLISPFTSIPDLGRRLTPFLPVGLLARDRFDNLAKAPGVALPVLVIHGEDDDVVPFALGRRLTRAFLHAELVPLPETHHNDVFDRHPELHERIARFAGG
ncbi:MAG TPA: alpha/beta fold hydrolase [Myxococcales bacterium]|nr:alpha/beta fold hydrolase [Myxococcales bacterium]